MKKALAGVLALTLVCVTAAGVMAQVPNVQVYFNGNPQFNSFSETQTLCGNPGDPQPLYVVMQNWNMFVQGVDFSIDYPAALFPGGEVAPANTLTIGNSDAAGGTGGIAIAWNLPQNGFDPLLALTVNALYTGACDCNGGPYSVVVKGYQYAINPGGKLQPQAVRWPDFAEIDGVGLTSLVCPGTIATEETTWGGIKALYR